MSSWLWWTFAAMTTPDAHACPVCGWGMVDYFEWQCWERGWEKINVGHAVYDGCAGLPVMVWGYETDWSITIRSSGNRMNPQSCNSATPIPPLPDDYCPPPIVTW